MTMRVYLYSTQLPHFDSIIIQNMLPTFASITPFLLHGVMDHSVSEPLETLDLYDLLIQDFDPEMVMIKLHEEASWLSQSFIEETITCLNPGFYTLERYLYEVTLDDPEYRKHVSIELEKLLDKEMIDTLLKYATYEMNASKASKKLYIHRNTLQYRFSIFHDKTGLDPRNFHTIALIYACFHARFMHSA